MNIGVLAIQGDFAAHRTALERIGVEVVEVRRPLDLDRIDGLILPGGESTTMLKLLTEEGFSEPIRKKVQSGLPIFGTCAGAILLARQVTNPEQHSLELIDISVERNAYGRQVDSFIARLDSTIQGGPLEAVFIRAPKITRVGPGIEVVARLGDQPVLVRRDNIIAGTFHPELTGDSRVHRLLVDLVSGILQSTVGYRRGDG